MKIKWTVNFNWLYFIVFSVASVIIFNAVKGLYFFDEDIFVVNKGSEFLQLIWQRCATVKFTYLLDNYFWGTNPLGYHITNIVFHIVNAILAMKVFSGLLQPIAAFITPYQLKIMRLIFCILFLFSPIHSEPLCYILGRDGMVVTFFCLIAVLFFLRSGLQINVYLFISLVSFLLALYSYEISWTMPFILLCIAAYIGYIKKETVKRKVLLLSLYLVVFFIWFGIKIIFINKGVVTDYDDGNFFSISFTALLKNNIILFFRNFIPPCDNSFIFISCCVLFLGALVFALFKLFTISKQVFAFCILLVLLIFLGFVPASLFGISSHNQESERYIYFSSVFAIMLLSVLTTFLIRNNFLLIIFVSLLSMVYATLLFKAIGDYATAGNFAKKYLSVINDEKMDKGTVFLVNQPSQYSGALMFRAASRMNNNTKFSFSTVNEFMSYLYPGAKRAYITLSFKKLTGKEEIRYVYRKPLDSVLYFFPLAKNNFKDTVVTALYKEVFPFNSSTSSVIAVNDTAIFIFK